MLHSSSKGQIAVLKICLEAAQRNIIVNFPSIEGTRYDCILDSNNQLSRAQIKFLNRRAGKNCLELKIEDKRYKNKKVYTNKEIDLILIYLPSKDCILCLKDKDFHNKKTLRFNLVNENAPTFYKRYIWKNSK